MNESDTPFDNAKEHAGVGAVKMQVSKRRFTRTQTMTTDGKKTKNKTLKKAKTNSNELASVTTRERGRESEREKRKGKDGVVGRFRDRAKGIWQW